MGVMAKPTKKTRAGRPASGAGGEKVSDYPQVMLRLPQPTKDALDALSGATGVPVWRLIDLAVTSYIRNLPEAQRKLISSVRDLRAATGDRSN